MIYKSSDCLRKFGFLLLLFSLALHAEEDFPTDTLHGIVVSASMPNHHTEAISSQALTHTDFQLQGITDVAEAFRRMAGTTLRDYGSAGGMKTLSVRGMGATHTGVILDGIAISDAECGQIDLSRFFLDQIEEVSLSIGDDANLLTPVRNLSLTANVTFSTLKTTKRFSGYATIKTGSFATIEPDLQISAPLSKDWSMQVKGHFLHADNNYPFTLSNGIATKTETRNHNAISSGTGMIDILHEQENGKHKANIKAYYYGADKKLPGQVVVYNPYNNEEQTINNAFVQGKYQTFWQHGLSIEAHVKGDWNQLVYRDFGTQYTDGIKENRYNQWEGYGGATLLWVPLKQWSFSVGTDYTYQQLNSNAVMACNTPFRHTFQGQISAKWHNDVWTARATLLGSDYENEAKSGTPARDAKRLSPSASIAWHQLSWLTLRVSYQDKFRMPTFSDNYYTKLGSRDLLPEKARGANVGASFYGTLNQQHKGRWNIDINGYYQWIEDKIVAIPMNMMFWNMVNVGKVESRGFEIKASVEIPMMIGSNAWSFHVDANYTLQEALNTTNPSSRYYRQQIAYTPVHSGGGSIALQTPWISLSFNGTIMSERYSTNEHQDITHLDPFHELGLALWHRFLFKKNGEPHYGLTLQGNLKNLTNQQYELVRGYPMPGISWYISTNFDF